MDADAEAALAVTEDDAALGEFQVLQAHRLIRFGPPQIWVEFAPQAMLQLTSPSGAGSLLLRIVLPQ
jgi:hypothetical protein